MTDQDFRDLFYQDAAAKGSSHESSREIEMIVRLFGLAAVVLFVLALIAANATAGTCLGVGYSIWIAAGLLAFALDHLYGSMKR